MKTRFAVVVVLALFVVLPVFSQLSEQPLRGGEPQRPAQRPPNPPRANQGRIPPAPPKHERHARPEPERHANGRVNSTPHVNKDHWYGHDRPDDRRYRLGRPFEHGRFEHFGPAYRYRIERFDRDHRRFWLPGGFFFEVAVWDWPICEDWCWDCDDDFVFYEDVDHIGWYLFYNIHTGVYVHVIYMGI